MAGERTEAATPRRLQDLRSQGRVAKSVDLGSAVSLLGGLFAIQAFGREGMARLTLFMQEQLGGLSRPELTDVGLADLSRATLVVFLAIMAPLLVALPLIGLVAHVGQSGLLFSGKAVAPDPDRINPLSGAKRYFSSRSLVELAKTVAKAGLLGYLVYRACLDSVPAMLALGSGDLRASLPLLADLLFQLGLLAGVVLLALGVLDFAYQRWSFQRGARMTKEELKEELRQSEGSPQTRARIRQLRRKLATRRMMQQVPKADVVVTNPTHFAVALAYRGEEMAAPQVVAKGADELAARIKQVARDNGVPVVENKPLAQALYRSVEVGMEIPAELFQAVAEVLAYIYALRARARLREARHGPGA